MKPIIVSRFHRNELRVAQSKCVFCRQRQGAATVCLPSTEMSRAVKQRRFAQEPGSAAAAVILNPITLNLPFYDNQCRPVRLKISRFPIPEELLLVFRRPPLAEPTLQSLRIRVGRLLAQAQDAQSRYVHSNGIGSAQRNIECYGRRRNPDCFSKRNWDFTGYRCSRTSFAYLCWRSN